MFEYLNQTGCTEIEGIDDENNLYETLTALGSVGFEQQDITSLQNVVVACLHLGNISFEPSDEKDSGSCATASEDEGSAYAQYFASKLLAIEQELVVEALCENRRTVRSEVISSPVSSDEASTSRDSLVRAMYGRAFKLLIARINTFTATNAQPNDEYLGILDMFGFEIFDSNRFEQLCINFANEKLQQQFTYHVFKFQEELFQSEGVAYTPVQFTDNDKVLNLFEGKSVGIFVILDEQVKIAQSSDANFLSRINKQYEFNELFEKDKFSDVFTIKHYAGEVHYEASGFIEKNRDTLFDHLQDLFRESEDQFVTQLADDPLKGNSVGGVSSSKRLTQAQSFRRSLDDLMASVESSMPHFIRCSSYISFLTSCPSA